MGWKVGFIFFGIGVISGVWQLPDTIKRPNGIFTWIMVEAVFAALAVLCFRRGWRKKADDTNSSPLRKAISQETTDSEADFSTGDCFISDDRTVFRADGKELTDDDIDYLRETGYERSHEYYENSPNPKFHRSEEEKRLKSDFFNQYSDQIQVAEQNIWLPKLYSFDSVDDAIDHAQKALIAAQALQAFCSKTRGGRLYFEDGFLHAHNSRNPDFSFIDVIKQRYSDLTVNYEDRKRDFELHKKRQEFLSIADDEVLNVIRQNEGVLQKDLHKHFDPDLKPTIGTAVSHLVKSNRITRVKRGNTFELTANE